MKPYPMRPHEIVVALSVNIGPSVGDAATQRPATSASSSSTIPAAVASSVFPGRTTFIQKPMPRAIGIVQRRVKTPHGDSASALTITRASTARRITMMARMAIIARMPVNGPISSFAIWPSDLPSRRTEAAEDDEILHGAAENHADHDPDGAGEVAELCGEHRTDERTSARDGGEMMAEQHPARRGHEIASVGQAVRRRDACVARGRRRDSRRNRL